MNNKSILLVDDEENILASIGWVLEKNNFRVTTATNGRQAIDLLRANHYDLVITDLIMTEVDGIAVLKQAKSCNPDAAVIILTGYGDVGSAVETLKLGAEDYLQKPCDIDDLLNKARRSFEKQDLVAKLRQQNEQLKNEIAARKIIEQELQGGPARFGGGRHRLIGRLEIGIRGIFDVLITHELQPALAGDTALEGFVPRPTRGAGSWRRDRICG